MREAADAGLMQRRQLRPVGHCNGRIRELTGVTLAGVVQGSGAALLRNKRSPLPHGSLKGLLFHWPGPGDLLRSAAAPPWDDKRIGVACHNRDGQPSTLPENTTDRTPRPPEQRVKLP
jgi:hypothetical protein